MFLEIVEPMRTDFENPVPSIVLILLGLVSVVIGAFFLAIAYLSKNESTVILGAILGLPTIAMGVVLSVAHRRAAIGVFSPTTLAILGVAISVLTIAAMLEGKLGSGVGFGLAGACFYLARKRWGAGNEKT